MSTQKPRHFDGADLKDKNTQLKHLFSPQQTCPNSSNAST
jgi:hypothetical protein